MPRGRIPVKNISGQVLSRGAGAVDLHFHGAFGIDLMTAEEPLLNVLSEKLYTAGVSGFCATTLSSPPENLLETCERLGAWIQSGTAPGALPLGIHLEGPFISPNAAGAHPPSTLRGLTPDEVERLWKVSRKTLKILTLAPETLDREHTRWITRFAKRHRIRLAIGHSRCTEAEAHAAFDAGFSGITHAWNALAYHHRDAGALGAAFGRDDVFTELIIDGVHVAETLIDWTLKLHPNGVVFVSDAAPAAGTDGKSVHAFGGLECRFAEGAARLANGALAGGGILLPTALFRWVELQAKREKITATAALERYLPLATERPLRAIFLDPSAVKSRPVEWTVDREFKVGPAALKLARPPPQISQRIFPQCRELAVVWPRAMKIYLHEIKDQDRELHATQADGWLRDVLELVDEDKKKQPERTAKVDLNLRRVDDVIVVSGDVDTTVQLLCSRCATSFALPIDEHFSTLYCKDREMAGVGYLDKDGEPQGTNQGFARHAHNEGTEGGTEATSDLDIIYIPEDYLDVASVVTEQIQLQVPFQPLCKEDCKGICSNCGADLNQGRCACAKIIGKNPFGALKDFKF